jgi:hypothetical protein
MAELPDPAVPSTPAASAAAAQSRGGERGAGAGGPVPCPGEGVDFSVGPGVERGARGLPYERQPGDPLYRPLRIYTLDPAAGRLEGATATVNVPYEPLQPGPTGHLFRVDPVDAGTGEPWRTADLEDPSVLIGNGRAPSPADPRFHQQMVYAVCSLVYASFRAALGRHVAWGFDPPPGEDPERTRLLLRPHGGERRNAWYDRRRGELRFGYYQAQGPVEGRNVPGGFVFTCLSHDIVAHEVTHALLDGLRAHFFVPTGPDVLAFHEGFADLIAVFQHFSYPEVVRAAVRRSRGVLSQAQLLTSLATQFGHTTGKKCGLRTTIDLGPDGEVRPRTYREDLEEHELGSVLVSAVFDAFLTVYARKTERYVRLATGGTGVLPPGELPADLQAVLAEEASQLASQFLNVCIRAIDYCPPVDLELGEFLRAVITADLDLVPHDPWGYREAWIDAFGRHQIYPPGVRSLAEDELCWKATERPLERVEALSFKQLQFEGDPACPAGRHELRRQACALGELVAGHAELFGLARRDDPALRGDAVGLPCVQSIRSSRRVGPDGQVVFDLVAEVTQRRLVRSERGEFAMYGGATVILGPRGEVRYAIGKGMGSSRRLERQRTFMAGRGRAYWTTGPRGALVPNPQIFAMLHGAPEENGDARSH